MAQDLKEMVENMNVQLTVTTGGNNPAPVDRLQMFSSGNSSEDTIFLSFPSQSYVDNILKNKFNNDVDALFQHYTRKARKWYLREREMKQQMKAEKNNKKKKKKRKDVSVTDGTK